MGKREPIRTKASEIVDYWSAHQDECGLSVDWADAEKICWRCGCKADTLERCHIIPDSLGGKDEPENLVLLCKRCHADNPNVTDPEIMWDWMRAYAVPFYGTFWGCLGLKEYEFIYRHKFYDDLQKIFNYAKAELSAAEQGDLVKNEMKELRNKVSYHFGQPYMNASTIAGMYRMVLKSIAEQMNADLNVLKEEDNQRMEPWWM